MSVGGPDQILSGKYRLERELGRGGMGSVWLAQHLTLHSSVAIKLIDPQIAQNPEALSRFLREAQAAASLRSPHVVQILDHGVDDGVPFIVMELLDGESLSARLERVRRLSPADTARIFTQVARAMTRAHEAGIVHRDLKPDNIFLVRNDEEEIAKVLDFGVAKSQSHGMGSVSSATRTGSVLGTPHYMSPEQAEGAKTVDGRSDIWSMGVIAWECLLGIRPFDAETLGGLLLAICARDIPVPSRCGVVPAGFDAWFARCCAREVAQRFSTAKEAAQELSRVCSSGQAEAGAGPYRDSAHSVPAPEPRLATTTGQMGISSPALPGKSSRAPLVIGALLGVMALAAGAALVYRAMAGSPAAAASAAHLASAATTATSPPVPPTPQVAPTAPLPPSTEPVHAEPNAPAPATAPPSAAVAPAAPAAPALHAAARSGSQHAAPAAPAAVAAPAPAPTPAPARPPAPANTKERVDLGI
jgi:serine/threonine protein kinase